MRSNKILLILLIPLIFCLSGYSQSDRPVDVRVNGEHAASLPAHWLGRVAYVPVSELCGHLGMRYHENTVKKKVVLTLGQHEIMLTQRNPFILVDKEAMQMPSPPLDIQGQMYVPLSFFIYASQKLFTQKLEFDPMQSVLAVLPGTYNITGVHIESKQNGGLIHIKTTRAFHLADISLSLNKNWLNVTIYGGTLDSTQIATEVPVGMFLKIIPYAFQKSCQLSFQTGQKIEHKEVTVRPGEIIISIRSRNPVAHHPDNNHIQDRKRWLIDTIVVDPGHGGRDPGALGSTVKEKTITMEIGKLLKEYLNKMLPDVKILMTRESDKYITLKDRTQFANSHDGKLFVSIHANANRNRNVRGCSTYILGRAKTQAALEVAQKENSVVEFEDDPEAYKAFEGPAFILNNIATNQYMKESETLAGMVNKAVKSKTRIPDKGVHQAGFWVLVGAAMPSILVETAFISNKYEERLLKSRSFQRKVSEAIGESICEFKTIYEQGIN